MNNLDSNSMQSEGMFRGVAQRAAGTVGEPAGQYTTLVESGKAVGVINAPGKFCLYPEKGCEHMGEGDRPHACRTDYACEYSEVKQ